MLWWWCYIAFAALPDEEEDDDSLFPLPPPPLPPAPGVMFPFTGGDTAVLPLAEEDMFSAPPLVSLAESLVYWLCTPPPPLLLPLLLLLLLLGGEDGDPGAMTRPPPLGLSRECG